MSSLRQEVKILKESIDKVDEANREGLWLCFVSILVLVNILRIYVRIYVRINLVSLIVRMRKFIEKCHMPIQKFRATLMLFDISRPSCLPLRSSTSGIRWVDPPTFRGVGESLNYNGTIITPRIINLRRNSNFRKVIQVWNLLTIIFSSRIYS